MIPSFIPVLLAALLVAQAVPTPGPEPAPAAAPTPSPSASPTPAPGATPPAFNYVVTFPPPAAGQPGILEVATSDQTLHSGGSWAARVTVTGDITAVTIEGYGIRLALFPYGEARFAAIGTIPVAPAMFLNRLYTVNAIGTTADGRRATAAISLRLVR